MCRNRLDGRPTVAHEHLFYDDADVIIDGRPSQLCACGQRGKTVYLADGDEGIQLVDDGN